MTGSSGQSERGTAPTGLAVVTAVAPPGLSARELVAVAEDVGASVADNTRTAYATDWARFTAWCAAAGHNALPAEPMVVAAYLAGAARLRRPDGRPAYAPATLTRWAASINARHTAAGHPAPGRTEVVRRTLAGIRKTRATPPSRVRPLRLPQLRTVLTAMAQQVSTGTVTDRLAQRRNAALLLLGFFGAFRASELANLRIADAVLEDDGLIVTVRQSKTDQQSAGQLKAIPRRDPVEVCGPCAFARWRRVLDAADTGGHAAVIRMLHRAEQQDEHVCHEPQPGSPDSSRPLFRPMDPAGQLTGRTMSGELVRAMIRTQARAAGLPAQLVDRLGGHSLRAGFVTDAFAAGAQPHEIMRQTGHRNPGTVEIYRRDAPLVGNAVTRLGLAGQ